MIEFRTFGRVDLRAANDTELSSVLVHPKRVALLTYLAVARPRGFHRRDTLLALLWPELDQERARAALRKAVHYLRRSFGQDVLVGRGDEELAIDATRLACDAARFDDARAADQPERALELYQGPFLEGFFLREAGGFEDWMERERARLHDGAFRAAWTLAERAERANDAFGAAHWARRAAALVPEDEPALRGLVAMLDRLGDRAGAIAAYEDFARRVAREYQLEPSTETRTLIDAVREGSASRPAASNVGATGLYAPSQEPDAHAAPPTPLLQRSAQAADDPRGTAYAAPASHRLPQRLTHALRDGAYRRGRWPQDCSRSCSCGSPFS